MALNPRITDWQGRLCWIVGASSGIGLATAQALAARGARLLLSARDASALEAAARPWPQAVALAVDATQPDAVQAAWQSLTVAHGLPDFVLYCAGHYQPMRAQAFSAASLRRHVDVNLMGAAHVLEAALPALLQRRQGHVSLVGSVAGYRGLPRALAYGPTKAALHNLAESLYLDVRPQGLGVSIVNPGFVQTPLTAQNSFHMPALLTPEQAAQHMLKGWADGRFEIHFPRRFTLGLKALRHVSDGLYFAAVQRATGTGGV